MTTKNKPTQGRILTISGISGSGKDAICSGLMAKDSNITFFATATTRKMRKGEKDGVNYYFLTKKTFKQYIKDGKFVEWVKYNGEYYGALQQIIQDKLNKGFDVISPITWDGAKAMKQEWPTQTTKFLIVPPSAKELKRRLKLRSKTSNESAAVTNERISKGLEDAKNWQKAGYAFTSPDLVGSTINDYDYVIINDDLDCAIIQMQAILKI